MASADLSRLTTIWQGLPSCSAIVFRHLQKTGGTSVVRLFEDLQRDWSDARYAAETDAQERLAEEERTAVGVVEAAGRWEGLDLR